MEMRELSRFELARVRRTAKNVKGMRAKAAKLSDKIAALEWELDNINQMINEFEAPIVRMTGGFTSEQVLNGNTTIDDGELFPEEEKVVSDKIEESDFEVNV